MSITHEQFREMDRRNEANKARKVVPTHTQETRTAQPVEHECDLHEQIWGECERRGWLVMHGAMNRRTSRSEGEEDFIIRADGGRVFFVEAKSKNGKLSPAQQAVHAHAAKLGHKSHVVRSIQEFNQIVSEAAQ